MVQASQEENIKHNDTLIEKGVTNGEDNTQNGEKGEGNYVNQNYQGETSDIVMNHEANLNIPSDR